LLGNEAWRANFLSTPLEPGRESGLPNLIEIGYAISCPGQVEDFVDKRR